MSSVTAADVKSLRERTGLPMMKCKQALVECNNDGDAAVEWLRKEGVKTQETRLGRDTSQGRLAYFIGEDPDVGTLIELACESAQVASHEDFRGFATDIAQQLATGPGAATTEELLAQDSPGKTGMTLAEQRDEMFNRIREVFNLNRIVRFDGTCQAYVHHDGSCGALVQYEGGNADLARDIAMHITANNPRVVAKDDLDPEAVSKEREILADAARKEGKPENIIEKMIEGRMRTFYAATVLGEQPFIKDDSQTVAKVVDAAGLKIVKFVAWQMGKGN